MKAIKYFFFFFQILQRTPQQKKTDKDDDDKIKTLTTKTTSLETTPVTKRKRSNVSILIENRFVLLSDDKVEYDIKLNKMMFSGK